MQHNSIVVQTRLNRSNADEDQAITVLERWQEAGHKTRDILRLALLSLDDQPVLPSDDILAIRQMITNMQRDLVDTIAALLDSRLDDLAIMEPSERRQYMQEEVTRRSSFSQSILSAVNVADYEDDHE